MGFTLEKSAPAWLFRHGCGDFLLDSGPDKVRSVPAGQRHAGGGGQLTRKTLMATTSSGLRCHNWPWIPRQPVQPSIRSGKGLEPTFRRSVEGFDRISQGRAQLLW